MWETGLHSAIINYGNLLPDDLIKQNPDFCLYYAWILISSGDVERAKLFLESAHLVIEEAIGDENSSKELVKYYIKLSGKIAITFAYLYSQEENQDKIFDFRSFVIDDLDKKLMAIYLISI